MATPSIILVWRISRENYIIPKDKSHPPTRLEDIQYGTGEAQRAIINNSSKNEAVGSKWEKCSVVVVLVVQVKPDAVKNNIA